MATILIVDDHEEMRAALAKSIEGIGHQTLQAPNGRIARDVIGAHQTDLVISDIQMPHMDGLELLEWCKQNHPTKYILMTGFSHIIETQSAHDKGADDFILKPFRFDQLKTIIERNLEQSSKGNLLELTPTESFCKVSIGEFVTKPLIEFDVYIRLSDSKHVKIGHAGTQFSSEQLERYRSLGLKYLYIRREDFTKFVRANIEIARVVKRSGIVSKEKKLNFVRYVGETLMEKVLVEGVDKETLVQSKEFLSLAAESIAENSDQVDLLEIMNNHSDRLTAICVSAALYSVMIARKMGMTSTSNFYKLSMAGLFHEIGMKEIDRAILDKPRPLLSQAERQLIESHCVRGKEILLVANNLPEDVVQIVAEHHEDAIGTGYPRGLKKHQQHPLSSILQTAVAFSETAIKSDRSKYTNAQQVIKFLEEMYGDRLDMECFRALQKIHVSQQAS